MELEHDPNPEPDLGLNQFFGQLQVLRWSLSEDKNEAARIHLVEKNLQALGYSFRFISSSRIPAIFFYVRRLNNLNSLDQLQVVQKLHVVLRRKLEIDVSILFVRNIGDCDEQIFLDLLRKRLNIPHNLFRDCVDQDLAFLLRASLVDHEPDLNFAIGTDSQRPSCVLTGSSASRGELLANICSVTICVRVAAQEGLALELSVAHGPP